MSRRFVVQQHTVGEGDVHFDLMIEDGGVLVTFQLEAPPAPGVTGRRSFDHRPRYLDYEGELSGGRGSVEIWDRGTASDREGGPRTSCYRVELAGGRLQAELVLRGGVEEGAEVAVDSV